MMDPNVFKQSIVSVRNRRCQIQECIGEGSHATIWLTKSCIYPHEEFVLKISRDSQGVSYERVQNEIWFLKEMKHPNIPEMIDHGHIQGCAWLAMPFFEKLSLSVPIKKAKMTEFKKISVSDIQPEGYPRIAEKISIKQREKLAIQVLSDMSKVIEYISGTGIVHADISPGNIMEKRNSVFRKHCMLIDWGASALIHRYPEDAFGSFHFTAPERFLGKISYKSDLFSLGIVCFYILTGMVPYSGKTGEEYCLCVIERQGIGPLDFKISISSSLHGIVRDLIYYNPEQRPEPSEVCQRVEKLCQSLEKS